MANSTPKDQEDILAALQCLEFEEAYLTEQKEQFSSMLNQLETKAKEEVKKMKQKVDSLTSAVLKLRKNATSSTFGSKKA